MSKLRLGMYCAAGCGGCDISLLEIHEHLLDVVAVADIAFWPAATDFKYADIEALPDGDIDVCFVNGAIRNSENIHIAKLLRAKSKVIVAYGACSSFGGVPGLANLYPVRDVIDRAFTTQSTDTVGRVRPSASVTYKDGAAVGLPAISGTVTPLSDIVRVDFTLPGCPPSTDRVWEVIQAIATGQLPASPAIVGAGAKSVCDDCRLEKKGTRVSKFVRSHEIVAEDERCLLEQGIVCMGPATRSGCGGQCTDALMPCRGCFGPAGDSIDQGAAMVAVLGTLVDSEDEAVIRETIAQVVDPAGTFYAFTLATSVLGRARTADPAEEVRS
jgi:F420-non-reducing hydrogenase small subunit